MSTTQSQLIGLIILFAITLILFVHNQVNHIITAQSIPTHFTQDIIDSVNNNPSISWKAKLHSEFAGLELSEIAKRLGGRPSPPPQPTSEQLSRLVKDGGFGGFNNIMDTIPASFDSREKWGSCIHQIRNQGNCGDCYAFASKF